MKTKLIIFIICGIVVNVTMGVCAQTVIHCQILEYRGVDERKPIVGAKIEIDDAGSTISNEEGKFTLFFNTLKRGDMVRVAQISKDGYEIFNTDAIGQWFIGDDFTILLCAKERFKALRDNYFQAASKSYEVQFQKERKEIDRLRKRKFLTKEEADDKLHQLEEEYHAKLNNIDYYVERFVRIDLREISDVEKNIIALVQKGEFEKAIAEYEKQNNLAKYKQETEDIKKIDGDIILLDDIIQYKLVSRDSLSQLVNKQIDLYKQEGGLVNVEKIGQLLKACADANTENYVVILKYASFAEKTGNIEDARQYYHKVLSLIEDSNLILSIQERLRNLEY